MICHDADWAVREAQAEDFGFVVELMVEALKPYYGGDHRAHAERIFSAHISGGVDQIGHFSFEQRMFVLTAGAARAGVIHLVGKRQNTYKISPIILAKQFRRRMGMGAYLLRFAEGYAMNRGARQLYCTVAERNAPALEFFVRNGYIIAGRSESHYKDGITELMLYKPLAYDNLDAKFDRANISVVPFEDRHESQVRDLLLAVLPEHFTGIGPDWIEALFLGHKRRFSGDVNTKYKLLYVAIDRSDTVLGVAAATPKKGEPIKMMPFKATSEPAFMALLTDMPYLLKPYGRKLYVHISPTVEETIALQRRGWMLDAAMPAAYHEERVTQQWSFDLTRKDFMRLMRVKQGYLDMIKSGRKRLEVRIAYDSIKRIQPGERIRLASRSQAEIIRVKGVRNYPTFTDMLGAEDAGLIAPGESDVLRLLQDIYPPDLEALGVVVLDIETER